MIGHIIFWISFFLFSLPVLNGESIEDNYTKYDMDSIEGNMTCNFKINDVNKTSISNYEIIDKKLMSEKNYQYAKNNCPYYGDGKWNDDKMICEINDPKEMGAYEDHICDEPTAKTEFPTIC